MTTARKKHETDVDVFAKRLLNSEHFFRYLQNEYKDAKDQFSLSPHLPDDIWLKIYLALDASSLVKLIATCKKFANLTHDRDISSKLHDAKFIAPRVRADAAAARLSRLFSFDAHQKAFFDRPGILKNEAEFNSMTRKYLHSSAEEIAENRGFILRI